MFPSRDRPVMTYQKWQNSSYLELHVVRIFLYLHRLRVFPSGCQQEIFDIDHLTRHCYSAEFDFPFDTAEIFKTSSENLMDF